MAYEKEINIISKDGVEYLEETVYKVLEDGTKEIACTACYPKQEDEPIEEITQEEVNAQILLNQTEIIANQESQDEVLAEVLLSGLGV